MLVNTSKLANLPKPWQPVIHAHLFDHFLLIVSLIQTTVNLLYIERLSGRPSPQAPQLTYT